MTLYSHDNFNTEDEVAVRCSAEHAVPQHQVRYRETAGYGSCTNCGCGGYSDNGTGDCYCGHSFGQHYS